MRTLPSALLCALMTLAGPLAGQYVTKDGNLRLLVPRPPQVQGPITKLLILGCREMESFEVAKALHRTLTSQTGFKVALAGEGSPLAKGFDDLEKLDPAQREALAATGASHVMLVRLERFALKEKKSREVVPSLTGPPQIYYKWYGETGAILHCPVLDLSSGKLTTQVPQNLSKTYYKENVQFEPIPETMPATREEMIGMAARKALQMVVPVQVAQVLPFMTQGDLDKVLEAVKVGHLDQAIALARTLAADPGANAKYQARIGYDLGLLLCLAGQPAEGLAALEAAAKAGYDKTEMKKALEVCAPLLPPRA